MNHNYTDRWDQAFHRIQKPMRTAFLSCFVIGLLVHLFAFTNLIPNSDGLSRMYDTQQMTISGRWFLHYASMFHAYIQAPALIGVLSLIFMGISAALTADLFQIKHTTPAVLFGGLFIAFPAMAYTYLYMFTASAYAFGILLAVLSIWIFRRWKHGFLPAAILLACAVGTYQAYFAVAVSIGLICVLLDLLNKDIAVSTTVKHGFRMIGMLLISAVIYYGVLQIFLHIKGLTLLDYRGIGSVGSALSFKSLLISIAVAYKQVFTYFLVPYSASYNTTLLTAAHWALAAAALISLGIMVRSWIKEGMHSRLVLLLVGFLILPLALNFTQLLSSSSPNMRISFVLAYMLAIALFEQAEHGSALLEGFSRSSCIVILLVSTQICNLAYTSSATAHRATQAFATNLVSRVEQSPGYTSDKQVVVIGSFPDEIYHSSISAFDLVEHYSCLSDSVMPLNKHVYYYLNDWLNVPWEEPTESTMIEVSDSDFFRNMPLYPDDGSVIVHGDQVIVKLAPQYKPKQPYEIEYEQRR